MGFFSEVARRRIAAGILVLGIVLVVLAITDTAFFDDPPTESEQVSGTVTRFFDAAGSGEFQDACGALTKQAQDVMRQAVARALGSEQTDLRCDAILETMVGDSFANVAVRVRGVSISGNRARVEAAIKPEGEPASFRTILLEENTEGSGWLISDFG